MNFFLHRLLEDLLRIERQQEKAGLGKRCSDFPYSMIVFLFPKTVVFAFIHFRQKKYLSKLFFIYQFIYLNLSFSQAYVQQLETSRIKLNQLEQELQRARAQVRN